MEKGFAKNDMDLLTVSFPFTMHKLTSVSAENHNKCCC